MDDPVIERAHYSHEPFQFDQTREYRPRFGKPGGFWYSAPTYSKDGWEHWCAGEDFNMGQYKSLVEINLDRILKIRTPGELDVLTKSYRCPEPALPGSELVTDLDWHRLAEQWAGIEIAPYQWCRRIDDHTMWYYGWDCSSGVVWDLSAVLSTRPVEVAA